MSLAIGYVLDAVATVAGDQCCPTVSGRTVAEVADEVRTAAQELLRTAGPASTVVITGSDPAATVERLAAAVVGLVITDDHRLADVRDPGDPPASVEVRSSQVWSDFPVLRLADGSTVSQGEFLSRLESTPPAGWPEDLVLLVRGLSRLGRLAATRDFQR